MHLRQILVISGSAANRRVVSFMVVSLAAAMVAFLLKILLIQAANANRNHTATSQELYFK